MKTVDVAIVGAGTAGLSALREVQKKTESFVLINDGPWGTMCARVGCMPSKALIEAANAFHGRQDFEELGIFGADGLSVSIPAVLARVRRMRNSFVEETLGLTKSLGDRAVTGRARLVGPNRVSVNGEELSAGRIILATGSRPVVPDKWRAFEEHLLTTDSLFEQLTLPPRLAVLGLGGVGAELAQAVARLGCEVTAFDAKTRIAGVTDDRVLESLLESLRRDFTVHLGHETNLSKDEGGIRVTAGDASCVVPRALVALGRRPNLDGIGLETLGAALDEQGKPEVDPATLQVGRLPVFLVGDADATRPVQHEAADEGHIAGRNAAGRTIKPYARRVPLQIVFTQPNVARVGASYDAIDWGKCAVGEAAFANQGRARLEQRTSGRIRVYADKARGTLLGAELCAPDGEHLGHFLALAIERSCTVRELLRTPFYHPTIEEGLREALREVAKQLPEGGELELEG